MARRERATHVPLVAGPARPSRAAKVGDRIREEIAEMLARGTIKQGGLEGLIVSSVEVTSDLGLARVFVRLLDVAPTDAKKRAAVAGLTHAAGFVRRELGSRIRLRHVPELRFAWDDGLDRSLRVHALLAEIDADARKAGPR